MVIHRLYSRFDKLSTTAAKMIYWRKRHDWSPLCQETCTFVLQSKGLRDLFTKGDLIWVWFSGSMWIEGYVRWVDEVVIGVRYCSSRAVWRREFRNGVLLPWKVRRRDPFAGGRDMPRVLW